MRKLSAALAVAFLMAGTAPVQAQHSEGGLLPPGYGHLSATVSGTTDYRFRGISLTDENPAIQGSLDWSHQNGVYLGVWGSNVDLRDAWSEFDVYGGYAFNHGEYVIDIGAVGYFFPGASSRFDYDFYEAKLAVNRKMGPVDTGVSVNYSPDYFRGSGDATYVAASVASPILDTGFRVNGRAGYQWIDDEATFGASDYGNWSLGVGYTLYGFDLDLKYVDTNISERRCNDNCDATAIFSVSRTLN